MIAPVEMAGPLIRRMQRHQAMAVLLRPTGSPARVRALDRKRGTVHQAGYIMAMRAPAATDTDKPAALPMPAWLDNQKQPKLDAITNTPEPVSLQNTALQLHPAQSHPAQSHPAQSLPAVPKPAARESARMRRGAVASVVKPLVQRLLGTAPVESRSAAPSVEQGELPLQSQPTLSVAQPAAATQPASPLPSGRTVQAFALPRVQLAAAPDATAVTAATKVTPATAPAAQPVSGPVSMSVQRSDATGAHAATTWATTEQQATALPVAPVGTSPSSPQGAGDGLDWGRLTAILRAHERQEQLGTTSPVVAGAATQTSPEGNASPGQNVTPAGAEQSAQEQQAQVPARPVAAEGATPAPIQRTPNDRDETAGHVGDSPQPAQFVEDATPPNSTPAGTPDSEPQADVARLLRAAPPARATDSAVHVIAARGPRPVQRKAARTLGVAADLGHEGPQATAGIVHIPTAPTEIGELPVDLWELIGETPPQTTAEYSSPAHQTAAEPAIGGAPDLPRAAVQVAQIASVQTAAAVAAGNGSRTGPQETGQLATSAPAPVAGRVPGATPQHAARVPDGSMTVPQGPPMTVAEAFLAKDLTILSSSLSGHASAPSNAPHTTGGAAVVQALAVATDRERSRLGHRTSASENPAMSSVTTQPWPTPPDVAELEAAPVTAPLPAKPQADTQAIKIPSARAHAAAAVQRQLVSAAGGNGSPTSPGGGADPENLANSTGEISAALPMGGAQGGEPDIQELASLVYAQIRRRLAIERERLG